MSCNGNPFNFKIESEDCNYILEKKYTKTKSGITPYELIIPEAGYYYVKITGITSTSNSYLFTIGGPTYDINKIEVSSGTVNLSGSNRTQTVHFNLSNNNDLPNNAIVYFIRMDGLTSTSAKNISVSNSKGNSVSLNQYVWQKDGLVNINMDVKDNWSAQFTYRKSTVFSPTLVLRYVYPVVE